MVLGILNVFNTLTLKQIFSKTKTFSLKKLENSFVVESTMIESETYPYKTALSEANVKANRMGSTKWTYENGPIYFILFFPGLRLGVINKDSWDRFFPVGFAKNFQHLFL